MKNAHNCLPLSYHADSTIDLSGNDVTNLHSFQYRTTLNRMDFKFVSHSLWLEKQNILHPHMRPCGNNLKCGNKAMALSLVFVDAFVEEGCSASLTTAHEKQT